MSTWLVRVSRSCIKVLLITFMLQYCFATPKPLKARPGPWGCKIAPLRKPFCGLVFLFRRLVYSQIQPFLLLVIFYLSYYLYMCRGESPKIFGGYRGESPK